MMEYEELDILESTASEKSCQPLYEIVYKHEEDIYRIEKIISDIANNLKKTLKEINNKLNYIENKLTELETKLEEQETVILVREVSFDEAKKMAEEYIACKTGEYIDPLELAEELEIPYEIAHEVFLALIKEGKLKWEE